MKQQAVEERRDWAADVMEVGLYSVLVLVVMLLRVCARSLQPPGGRPK
jgi:hypothetical protein